MLEIFDLVLATGSSWDLSWLLNLLDSKILLYEYKTNICLKQFTWQVAIFTDIKTDILFHYGVYIIYGRVYCDKRNQNSENNWLAFYLYCVFSKKDRMKYIIIAEGATVLVSFS